MLNPRCRVRLAVRFRRNPEIRQRSSSIACRFAARIRTRRLLPAIPTGRRSCCNGAYKTFVEITDDDNENNFPDGMAASADNFDTKLLALSATHFGTAAKRNYTFHAIVGVVADPTDRLKPYPRTPLVNTKCTSAVNIGTQHQNMAIKTGGLRYPICNTDDYSPVFKAVADSVIKGAKVVCDFALPPPPPMQTFKLDTAQLGHAERGRGTAHLQSGRRPISCKAGLVLLLEQSRPALRHDLHRRPGRQRRQDRVPPRMQRHHRLTAIT